MRIPSPLLLLGTLGALSTPTAGWAGPVDTSEWKCSACPFEKGSSGSVDLGAGYVSQQAAKFADYTGLDKGGYVIADGAARFRTEGGLFGSLWGTDLGLDSRALGGQIGQEGLYTLRLDYDELPRYFWGDAQTPFLGNGSGVLTLPTLPPGFPAPATTAMPLASTLQPVELGYKRSVLDAGLSVVGGENWTYRLNARHDVKDGTLPTAGSFFSTASHLTAPMDQVTDQFELGVQYASKKLQASLAYYYSTFRNGQESLTWSNPFSSIVPGDGNGQLALPPSNQFYQVVGSLGYEFTPQLRASADIAYGHSTQNETFLAPTLNPNLASTLPPLPTQSLQGEADVYNGNIKLTALPMDGLRITGTYARNVRENNTASQSYPAVATDMFVRPVPRTNLPYSFWQDRFSIIGDYRGPDTLKTIAGIEQDDRERSYQEVVTTRLTTLWGSISGQPREDLALSMKLAYSLSNNSVYGIAQWVVPPQNPLLRKFNLADRQRTAAKFRADWTASEKLTIGLGFELAYDDYEGSSIGLTSGRTYSLNGEIAYALSEQTQLRLFALGERIRSQQAGSQTFSNPDWWGSFNDEYGVLGMGAKHVAMDGKLELGADLGFTRSRASVNVDNRASPPGFPTVTTSTDRLKLYAAYRLKDNLSLIASYWYERYESQNWAYDGITSDTLPDLLAFGVQSPHYNVNVFRLGLRYRF